MPLLFYRVTVVNRLQPFSLFGIVATLLIALPASHADTVELSGGGHLTGKVKRLSDKKVVIVQVDDDVRIAIPESRVRRVIASSQMSAYEQHAIKAGNDAELHYKLAIWCVKAKNFPGDSNHYKRYHMERAIEIDPDHEEARASLGYKKEKGEWVRTADLWRRRGMILVGGRGWQLPEAVLSKQLQSEAAVTLKTWNKEVNRLVLVVLRGKGKVDAALASLSAIEDPLAAEAIARQLNDSRGTREQSRDLRLLWVKLLGRFRNGDSIQALVLAGINEPDDYVREAALTELLEYGGGSATSTYLPMLKSNDNKIVNRAARALSWFPDPELALTYVDALTTTHTTEIAPGAGMQVGLGGDGNGGLAMGGKKQVITRTKQNPSVLGLLNEIEPEVNYGYDEQRWREHFAARLTAFDGDLRRDP